MPMSDVMFELCSPRLSKKEEKEKEEDIFKKGMCDAFAIALSRLNKKHIYAVRGYFTEDEEEYFEDCHIVTGLDYNKYMDVEGIKNKNKLFLARDRIGVKPLYYYFDGKRFIFSSM